MKPSVDHWVRSRKTFPWPAKRSKNKKPNVKHRQRIKTCTKRLKTHKKITLFLPKTRGIDVRRGASQRAKVTTPSREQRLHAQEEVESLRHLPINSSSFPSQRLCWIYIYCILCSLTPSREIPHLTWHLSGAHKQCAHYSVFFCVKTNIMVSLEAVMLSGCVINYSGSKLLFALRAKIWFRERKEIIHVVTTESQYLIYS